MPLYQVSWIIELAAESPEEATREALEIQRDPDSVSTFFLVTNLDTDKITLIDMADIKGEV